MNVQPEIGKKYWWRSPATKEIIKVRSYLITEIDVKRGRVLLVWDNNDEAGETWYAIQYFRDGYMVPTEVEVVNE